MKGIFIESFRGAIIRILRMIIYVIIIIAVIYVVGLISDKRHKDNNIKTNGNPTWLGGAIYE